MGNTETHSISAGPLRLKRCLGLSRVQRQRHCQNGNTGVDVFFLHVSVIIHTHPHNIWVSFCDRIKLEKSPTYCHEVLMVPGLQLGQGSAVQQQSIGHIRDELQWHVALKTRHHGREPGIAVSLETVLVLLALRPFELSWALAPWEEEEETKLHELVNAMNLFFLKIMSLGCNNLKIPLSEPLTLFCYLNYFFSLHSVSLSLIVFFSQSAFPFGDLSLSLLLTPSVSLMQMFSFVAIPQGESLHH